MDCPVCNKELHRAEIADSLFSASTCPSCKGLWFVKGELDRVDDSVWTDVEALPMVPATVNAPRRSCPECKEAMESLSPRDAAGLVVDRCSRCLGFWLDAGELDRMRDVAARADVKTESHMTLLTRPSDWSFWRWFGYCLGKHLVGPLVR